MTRPLPYTTAPGDTSERPLGVLVTLDVPYGLPYAVPINQAVLLPVDLWPREAFEVNTACRFSWDWFDIRRFLSFVVPDGKHDMFTGAKSRGKGNTQWYGSFRTKGRTVRAHKFYGVAVLGFRPTPDDHIDHFCNRTRCISCLRVLPSKHNLARIRRPNKQILELAKELGISPAEVMNQLGGPDERRIEEISQGRRSLDAATWR